jgi:hypothetical protein
LADGVLRLAALCLVADRLEVRRLACRDVKLTVEVCD